MPQDRGVPKMPTQNAVLSWLYCNIILILRFISIKKTKKVIEEYWKLESVETTELQQNLLDQLTYFFYTICFDGLKAWCDLLGNLKIHTYMKRRESVWYFNYIQTLYEPQFCVCVYSLDLK